MLSYLLRVQFVCGISFFLQKVQFLKQGIYDTDENFHRPVIETNPEVAERYLKKIERPMDLQTIRDKISSYRVISELQDDLILMFKNCYDFNTKSSGYKQYAM